MTEEPDMIENPEWPLRQANNTLTIDLANATSRADAAEKRIEQLIATINEQEVRIATAWRERDAVIKDRITTEHLLRSAIELLAHFAGRR